MILWSTQRIVVCAIKCLSTVFAIKRIAFNFDIDSTSPRVGNREIWSRVSTEGPATYLQDTDIQHRVISQHVALVISASYIGWSCHTRSQRFNVIIILFKFDDFMCWKRQK